MATPGNKIPLKLKERIQSPSRFLLSPNDDSLERAQARAARAAHLRRKSFVAMPDVEGTEHQDEHGDSLLSKSQILDLFQNCIKLSTENKINQHNTWELPLIDHLSDIIKADSDEDTNFQKASCTLEASAKIYSYRVDSVHSETYKVLGGLNRTSVNNSENHGPEGDQEDSTSAEDAEHEHRRESQRKSLSTCANLESLENLNVKQFDVAFNVDPLFHQTSAQFDEGGAKGLLLNNLSVYRGCEIVFDSWDIPDKKLEGANSLEEDGTINLSFLEDTINQMLDYIGKETQISPTLQEILKMLDDPLRDAAQVELNAQTLSGNKSDECTSWFDNHNNTEENEENETSEICDAGEPDQYEQNNFDIECDGDASPDSTSRRSCSSYDEALGDGEVEEPADEYGHVATDPTIDWIRASMGLSSKKNVWAGADHWKFIKPKDNHPEVSEEGSTKVKKRKKEPFSIDFTKLYEVDQSLFAPPRDLRSTLLPNSRKPVITLLPEDCHYQAEDLLRLFLRPAVMIFNGRQKNTKSSSFNGKRAATPITKSPWHDEGNDMFGSWDDGDGDTDFEDPEIHDLVPQPRKVSSVEVNYDKTSKQVDVRVLKSCLWEQLQAAPQEQEQQAEVSFRHLMRSLPADCPAAAPADISVHLCFICLLHLANEHNLLIKDCPSMDELLIHHT